MAERNLLTGSLTDLDLFVASGKEAFNSLTQEEQNLLIQFYVELGALREQFPNLEFKNEDEEVDWFHQRAEEKVPGSEAALIKLQDDQLRIYRMTKFN